MAVRFLCISFGDTYSLVAGNSSNCYFAKDNKGGGEIGAFIPIVYPYHI